ncbi:MAG: 30S ribosome-binding factor RbfA [Bacteroidetes bacterium]|nr:MAG: 30S ribosome-binding factor RbfA [Bacteroidota bacterium]
MESTRQQKISKLLMKDLGELFQKEVPELILSKSMITVTKVSITRDLSFARVYLSIFAAPNKDDVISKIGKANKSIRMLLGKKIRHQVRIIPELAFELDDSLDYIDRIEELLND